MSPIPIDAHLRRKTPAASCLVGLGRGGELTIPDRHELICPGISVLVCDPPTLVVSKDPV